MGCDNTGAVPEQTFDDLGFCAAADMNGRDGEG
jgi:hypothetical protein